MNKRRVVITGLGIVSPVGNDVSTAWENIKAGKSGVTLIDRFDVSDYASKIAGTIRDFDATQYMPAKELRRNDIFIHYAVAAAAQAMKDSGLEVTEENSYRIGTALGSGIGGLPMIEKGHQVLIDGGPRKLSPFFIPGTIINLASGCVCLQHKLRGPNIAIVTACTTGTHNIGMAARLIAYGDADAMVCGGTEMATSPTGVGGFAAMRALSTRNDEPEKASRPWDKDRDGFVLGEGAGVLVLEEYEAAVKRGATIYAEVAGFGMSDDAYHITSPAPEGEGGRRAMELAMKDAGVNPDEVDYVNAHATSTPVGDELEAAAIANAFKTNLDKLAVSSTKSMTGHLLGAAGAVEAIFSVLAMRDGIAPPTINLDHPDGAFPINYVPNTAQERNISIAISNSFGFGGTNGSLLFRSV
ncbi:MAG: beta-ketoacyl-[acyl-carrier-protein] synthase II [Legionellaceae bacterium]|nr:beta-ketoacyl-[acyl-carrier-protein] synthase II [Legionellaceae bacterium]